MACLSSTDEANRTSQQGVTLTMQRGNLFVCGPIIDDMAKRFLTQVPQEYRVKQQERDGSHYHITVVQKKEIASSDIQDKIDTILAEGNAAVNECDIVPLGLGKVQDGSNEAIFVVVHSKQLREIRARVLGHIVGQNFNGFHITLGFATEDIHTKRKTARIIVPPFVIPTKEVMKHVIPSAWAAVQSGTNANECLEVLEFVLQALANEPQTKERRAKVLDAICALHCTRKDFASALSQSEELETVSKVRGLVRKCQAFQGLEDPIKSNFAGLAALELLLKAKDEIDDTGNDKAIAFVTSILAVLECPVDSRCVFENFEAQVQIESPWRLKSAIETADFAEQIHRVFGTAAQQRWEHQPIAATERRCVFNPHTQTVHRLPRLFSWLIPQRLCGMSTPRNESDIDAVANALSVGLVVSLTIESPLPSQWFRNKSCMHAFLPVDNYEPPSLVQVDEFIALATATMLRKQAVLVHCGGGKGRAGTMLACWLVRMGVNCGDWDDLLCGNANLKTCIQCTEEKKRDSVFCMNEGCAFSRESIYALLQQQEKRWSEDATGECFTAKQAIDALQLWRPGSIETTQQEQFVHEYASELWRRKSRNDLHAYPSGTVLGVSSHYEPAPKWTSATDSLIIKHGVKSKSSSKSSKIPSVIVAMGLPGSGKSTLGDLIKKKQSASACNIISGDELGGRMAVENAIGNAVKHPNSIIYVDRCHVDESSRVRVLDLAFNPSDACLVFMDVPADECINRVKARLDHPTIEQGTGQSIVEAFAKRMEVPSDIASEGFAKMYHIKSKRAFDELCQEWGLAIEGQVQKSRDADSGEEGSEKDESKEDQRSKGLPGFTKFPRTPHLLRMAEKSVSRDDLLIADAKAWLYVASLSEHSVTVEEKIDGANLGISADPCSLQLRVQNRSHYVSGGDHPQFSPLNEWLAVNRFEIQSLLQAVEDMFPTHGAVVDCTQRRTTPVLFGEWVVARHSIAYDAVPDYFVAFDILLPNSAFASRKLFHNLLKIHAPSIATVPTLFSTAKPGDMISVEQLKDMVVAGKSKFRTDRGKLEGVYVRIDDDAKQCLKDRSKIVRADFIAGNEHWTKHSFQRNGKKQLLPGDERS